ncbi:MAG: aminopeptidase P N-terminal domain-containing protein [Planctomycetes bacterium]|nr:aminopeptidase P N-terminal domain-containing protein [Planctomycetota bacterium]
MCADRRRRLLAKLGDGLLLLRSGGEQIRNGDVTWSFRPGSDFYYLTGFPEPDAILCCHRERVRGRDVVRTVLFVRPRDKLQEIWHGRRVGAQRAGKLFGLDEARPIDEFWTALPELLAPHRRLYVRLGDDAEFDRRLLATCAASAFTLRKRNVPRHPELVDPTPALADLRVIKEAAEITAMEQAAELTSRAHVAAMLAARPGLHEYEIQQVLEGVFRAAGSRRNGYDSIVASGSNACILHYTENDRKLRGGELLLLDAGTECGMYTADITRTWPVDGTFTNAQAAVYDVVLKAQLAAIRQVRPGRPWDAIHKTAVRVLTQGLVELGVLRARRGGLRKLIADEAYKPFYMHGTGHWLGLDVHDAGAYYDAAGKPLRFRPGMVITVEPGLYFDPSDRKLPSELRGIGVRIEDDVLVTRGDPRVLTASCPKTRRDLAQVFAARAASRRSASG